MTTQRHNAFYQIRSYGLCAYGQGGLRPFLRHIYGIIMHGMTMGSCRAFFCIWIEKVAF